MKINRRMIALTSIGLPLIDRGFAPPGDVLAESSPVASPMSLTPEQALDLLLTTPFLSPLLPAYLGEPAIVEWTVPSAEDFQGVLGGVAVSIDPGDPDTFIGTMAIFPDEATAMARIEPYIPAPESSTTDHRFEVGGAEGMSGLIEAPSPLSDVLGYAFCSVSTSFAVIAGSAWGESVVGLELSSVVNLLATLDHFQRVVTVQP